MNPPFDKPVHACLRSNENAKSLQISNIITAVRNELVAALDGIEVYRKDEEVYHFVWHVRKARYSLEIDLEEEAVFVTETYTTQIFAFHQLDALREALRQILRKT